MNQNRKGSKANPKKPKQKRAALTSYAAAAVSSSLAQRISFASGARDGNLRITYRLPVCQIGNSGTTGYAGLLTADGTYTESLQLAMDSVSVPTSGTLSYWQSVGINLMAECFTRYRHNSSIRLSYCPQSTSASTDRLVFGFASDPAHPLTGGNSDVATQTSLLGLRESIPFAPWNEWSMNCHVDTSEKYTYSSDDNSAESKARFTNIGSFGCVGLSSVSSPTVYGVLYVEGTVEFEDMNPLIVLTSSPTYRRKSQKMSLHNEEKVVFESVKDEPKPQSTTWFGSSSSSTSTPPKLVRQ